MSLRRRLGQAVLESDAVRLRGLMGETGGGGPSVHNAVTLNANADTILSLTNQELGLDTQAANTVWAGPTAGGAVVPTFRALVAADIPALGGTPALTYSTSNVAGAASTYVRTDATLAIFDATVPGTIECDDAAAAGSAGVAARRDHQHAIVCTIAVNISTANSEGTATSFARADHVHNHPAGLGVNLHHSQQHTLVGADHTAAGLTVGHVLRATGATTFGFQALVASDLPVHTHSGAAQGGQLDWDNVWSDAVHSHTSNAEGGTITVSAISDLAYGTPSLTFGTSNAAGAANTVMRTDATLAIFDATVPGTIECDDAAVAGSAGVAARRDHQHAIVCAIAVNISTANAEGAAASFARADHVHNHPSGLGANLHHNQQHALVGADHTAAGLTVGHVLRATGATTFAFQALVAGDLPAHTHSGAGQGGQLDWDDVWSDAVHSHASAGEGGQLDWDNVWSDAVHSHTNNAEGGTITVSAISNLAYGTPSLTFGTSNAAGAANTVMRTDATLAIFDATVPGTIQPDASASAGSAGVAARRDHRHAIVCAAPGSNLTVSTSNSEGSATSFARSDHSHAITSSSNPGSTAAILATNSSGHLVLLGLGIGAAGVTANRITMANGTSIGQATGPLLTFDDPNDALEISGCNVFVNDTSNAGMSRGITINQGANDDEIFACKSSDVAHGVTSIAETDTFGFIVKQGSANGGARYNGVTEGIVGAELRGYSTTANTTKTAAGAGAVHAVGLLKSGTTYGNASPNMNIFAVRTSRGGSIETVMIVDEDGDIYYDGGLTAYDDEDDARAVQVLARGLAGYWSETLEYNREWFEKLGIVHYDDKDRAMISHKRLTALMMGAIGQLYERCKQYELMLCQAGLLS